MFTYANAVIVGGCLSVLYLAALLITLFAQMVWAWIDDSKIGRHWIISFIMVKVLGFKDDGSNCFPYYKPNVDPSCGMIAVLLPVCLLAFLPAAILTVCELWLASIVIASCIALAHTARFVKRLSKKFKLHTKDKDAHKEV